MTKTILLSLSFSFLMISLGIAQKGKKVAKAMNIPMQADYWDYEDGQVEFITHESVPAMRLAAGRPAVTLKETTFKDGTIEFDVAVEEGPFVHVYFRRKGSEESECVYLRIYRAGDPMGWDAVQYASFVKGINLWDLLPHYQGPGILNGDTAWNHVKLVISGEQMLVYVNDMQREALQIPELTGNLSEGDIAFSGRGIFANLVITPNAVEGLSPQAGFDPIYQDIRYIRNWSVSQPVPFAFGRDIQNEDLPNDETEWQPISAERMGLINLTRRYGGSPTREDRRLVWLKTSIEADFPQVRSLDLGFSDEIWVILNGQLLYVDKNYYASLIMKTPNGRISVENSTIDLPLRKGENELLIGVGNFFFGWGLVARFDMVDGFRFD